jgi:hypothetical protein
MAAFHDLTQFKITTFSEIEFIASDETKKTRRIITRNNLSENGRERAEGTEIDIERIEYLNIQEMKKR